MKFTISLVSVALATVVSFGSMSIVEASCSALWGQCGGVGWTGPTCCVSGAKCVPQANNKYYSQCLPGSGSSNNAKTTTTTKKTTTAATAATAKATSGSSSGYSVIPGGASGPGETTRYWDCCKPSCSWSGKADVTSPVASCAKNGIDLINDNVQNGCVGGSAYACNNNQPWAVNDNLAYGFAAASIVGGTEGQWCCACYELTFTSGPVTGKKMVVQVTNSGADLESADIAHFDLMMPGGGVGYYNGCTPQWGAPAEGWGVQYGGVSSLSDCNSLPTALQPGCKWRFGWFMGASNPNMTFKQVTCPAELIKISNCSRL